jgi:hypothetical protein
MSLAKRLSLLRVWFDECANGFAEFTATGAKAFSNELRQAITEAEALEEGGSPFVAAEPAGDAPDGNVVPFPLVRRMAPRAIPIGDGGAR